MPLPLKKIKKILSIHIDKYENKLIVAETHMTSYHENCILTYCFFVVLRSWLLEICEKKLVAKQVDECEYGKFV